MSILLAVIAVFGLTYYYGEFAKVSFYGIFILEIIAAFFFVAVILSKKFSRFILEIKKNHFLRTWWAMPVLGLLVAGLVRLSFDVLVAPRSDIYSAGWSRILQHALFFVYPFIWTVMGVWISFHYRQRISGVVYVMLVAAVVPNLWGEGIRNPSVGPLAIPFVVSYLVRLRPQQPQTSLQNFWPVLAVVVLGAAGLPIFVTWSEKASRLNSLLVIVALVIAPFLVVSSKHWRRALLLAISGVISAMAVIGTVLYVSHGPDLPKAAVFALQKGEDKPLDDSVEELQKPVFQQRFRKFLRAQALSAWMSAPIFGVGMVPEVPAYLREGVKNDGNFSRYPDMTHLPPVPISGPHNSYLNTGARLGVVGFFFQAWLLIGIGISMLILFRRRPLVVWQLIALFSVLNFLIHAAFNIGFEAPYNCAVGWLMVGILFGVTSRSDERKVLTA